MTPTTIARMAKIFECVPNISEGRRADVIDAVARAAAAGSGVTVVDVSSDASHNRSVLTLVGTADGVLDAAVRLAGTAVELIDLRAHAGEHPRMGAVDVIPFIPVGDATMDEAVLLARRCAQAIWERFRLPSYFYAAAATNPQRRKLADLRKGQFEGLISAVKDPDRRPDVGEPALHPSAGIVAIGARDFLIAYNVNLGTADLKVAERIAQGVRQMSGGFYGIQAKGFSIDAADGRTFVQVSMNVLDYRAIPLYRVTELIRREAAAAGVAITNCELVGLTPLAAVTESASYYLHLDKIDNAQVTW
jgi:glutamate formiminotransferase